MINTSASFFNLFLRMNLKTCTMNEPWKFKDYAPFTDCELQRNVATAFKDAVYPMTTAWATSKATQEFAVEYLTDLKRELLDDEQYEKLCQFHQMENMYGIKIP